MKPYTPHAPQNHSLNPIRRKHSLDRIRQICHLSSTSEVCNGASTCKLQTLNLSLPLPPSPFPHPLAAPPTTQARQWEAQTNLARAQLEEEKRVLLEEHKSAIKKQGQEHTSLLRRIKHQRDEDNEVTRSQTRSPRGSLSVTCREGALCRGTNLRQKSARRRGDLRV